MAASRPSSWRQRPESGCPASTTSITIGASGSGAGDRVPAGVNVKRLSGARRNDTTHRRLAARPLSCRAPIPPQAPRFENVPLIDYDFARWGSAEERTRLIDRWQREVRAGAR